MSKYSEAIETLKCIYPSQKEIKTGEYDGVADAIDIALEALRAAEARENPRPLTLEELKHRAEKPYWHVSLQRNDSHWAILPEHVAQRPQDYQYNHYWLAYDYPPKEAQP